MVRFSLQFVVIVAMHPMWHELNTIVSTLCAVTATDGTTTKRDETRSQRKTTRTPTPYRGTPYVCPSPTNAQFHLRYWGYACDMMSALPNGDRLATLPLLAAGVSDRKPRGIWWSVSSLSVVAARSGWSSVVACVTGGMLRYRVHAVGCRGVMCVAPVACSS
jgi:hypothetical protein